MTKRPASPALPLPWRGSARAWHLSGRLTRSRVDLLLRARSAAGLPIGRDRFRWMDLPDDVVEQTLRQVRSLADWDASWTRTAQGFLAEARRLGGEERPLAEASARRRAAFAYHVAQFFTADDPKKTRVLRASATALFARSLPTMLPTATRVEPVWRAGTLPGYLLRSDRGGRPTPLAVVLNGAGSAKEETLLWAEAFRQRGIAVLALDWPGTGETTPDTRLTPDCDDLTDGILALAKEDAGLNERRVAVIGIGLGGALAVRCAVSDRRIAAVVAVTPPYDAVAWLPRANPVLVDLVGALTDGTAGVTALAAGFALPDLVGRLRCPLLVCGAARDLLVPPPESVRLASAVGELATLLWFPRGGHGLFGAMEEWTADASRWLATLFTGAADASSTPVDPTQTLVAVGSPHPSPERSSGPEDGADDADR